MDFDFAREVAERAFEHVKRRTPLAAAGRDVLGFVAKQLPAPLAKACTSLDLERALEELRPQVTRLLQGDPPEPHITGLWFGIVELVQENESTEMTLYLAGSSRFDPDDLDPDWPCGPEWFPEGRHFTSEILKRLSSLRPADDADTQWLVECAVIEPVVLLLVAAIVQSVPADQLLGGSPYRGIGTAMTKAI